MTWSCYIGSGISLNPEGVIQKWCLCHEVLPKESLFSSWDSLLLGLCSPPPFSSHHLILYRAQCLFHNSSIICWIKKYHVRCTSTISWGVSRRLYQSFIKTKINKYEKILNFIPSQVLVLGSRRVLLRVSASWRPFLPPCPCTLAPLISLENITAPDLPRLPKATQAHVLEFS